jgi:hypothetical protein
MRALADAAKDVARELGAAVLILIVARDAGGVAAAVLGLTGLAGWFAVSRWRWPYKPCSSCKTTGRNRGSNKKRHGDCKRCGGTRRVQRPGARLVHRAILTIRNRKEKDHV